MPAPRAGLLGFPTLILLLVIDAAERPSGAHAATTKAIGVATSDISAPRARRVYVSAAGEALIRDVWRAGGLRNNPVAESIVRELEQAEEWSFADDVLEHAHEHVHPHIVQALASDAIANNRALSTCTCQGRPITQAEPSIAAWGPYVVASWNDRRVSCLPFGSPSQGLSWSMDYGATFREGDLLRGPGATDVFHGDPTVAVNKKTGDFYLSGLLRREGTVLGVVAARGRFGPDSFAIDLRKVVVLGAGSDLIDKCWMAVDSISGNVFVTWTNFRADRSVAIELQRLDRDLEPLGPMQVLADYPGTGSYAPQGSYVTVGANGEIYVPYTVFYGTTEHWLWSVPSRFEMVRSDDGGQTFGAPSLIATFDFHSRVLPPGNQRGFGAGLISMDVDRSHGPHRGRLHAVWAENRPIGGALMDSASFAVDSRTGYYFATARPFTAGARLRGTYSSGDIDFFKFAGRKGEVFVFANDSTNAPAVRARLICPRDTSAVARYHLLFSPFPSGLGSGPFGSGLPYDGDYYLQIESPFNNTGAYRFATGIVPPPAGARSRDVRDVFYAYSDDGEVWSSPVRLNDDELGFENYEPAVAVDGRGRVHAFWLDWRDDLECGTTSHQYGVSSGDGGVTWGPNRRLSDASSFWGQLASCSNNNQGDYMQMAADGDHVYAAFPDSRLGDPDIFVDPAVYRIEAVCPPDSVIAPGASLALDFGLDNGGNFETPLAWRVVDDAGWITTVSPSPAGQASIAPGASSTIRVALQAPGGCSGDSTWVRFITSDPAIPGAEDTCVTLVRCDQSVPVLVALIGKRVVAGRVDLDWWVSRDAAGATATVLRRDPGLDWRVRGVVDVRADGRVGFADRDAPAGLVGYRLVIDVVAGERIESETWIEVPAGDLALETVHPNPATREPFTVDFSLPSSSAAAIDILDMAGRRVATRGLGKLDAGRHRLRLSEASELPDGIYLVVLRQSDRSISRKAVIAR